MKQPVSIQRPSPPFALVLALLLVPVFLLLTPLTATAATSLSQCNGTDNVGGQAVECHYTITNNLNGSARSSTVTLQACHGAANAPSTLVCTTSTTSSADLVTVVNQCNGSGNGGGGTVTCSVDVVNNLTGTTTPTSATVNQCNVSGTGGGTQPTVACNPFPANTSGATVTQCNGSGTGGGGTQRVRCMVHSGSTTTSLLTVTVDQCNGSGTGGGATVICRTGLTNNITAAGTTPAPSPVPGSPGVTPAPGTTSPGDSSDGGGTTDGGTGPGDGGTTDGGGGTTDGGTRGGDDGTADGGGGTERGDTTGGEDTERGSLTGGATTGQISKIPTGGVAAGRGVMSGVDNPGLGLVGFVLFMATGTAVVGRWRATRSA